MYEVSIDDLVGCFKQGRKQNQKLLVHLSHLPFTNVIDIYLFDLLARLDSFIIHQHSLSFLLTPGDVSKLRVAWNKTQDVLSTVTQTSNLRTGKAKAGDCL